MKLKDYVRIKEREYINAVLSVKNFNMSATAKELGIDRKTLYNKTKHLRK